MQEISTNSTGVSDKSKLLAGVMTEMNEIHTNQSIPDQFYERDQVRADKVGRHKCIAAFPSNEMLIHSVMTNGINNSLITMSDIKTCRFILRKSRYISQGKTTMKSSSAIDVDRKIVELLPIIKLCYGNVELEVVVLNANNIPFLISI